MGEHPGRVAASLRHLAEGTGAHAASIILLALLGLAANWLLTHIAFTFAAAAIASMCLAAWITHRFARFAHERQRLRWYTAMLAAIAAACITGALALVPPSRSPAGYVLLSTASQEALITVGSAAPLPDGQVDGATVIDSMKRLSEDVPFVSRYDGRVRAILFLHDEDAGVLWIPSRAFTLGCDGGMVERIGGIWCNSPSSSHSTIRRCFQQPDRAQFVDITAADLLCQPNTFAESVLPNVQNALCVALANANDPRGQPLGVLCIISDRKGGLSDGDVPVATAYAFALSRYLSKCTLPAWKHPRIHVRGSTSQEFVAPSDGALQPFAGEAGPPPFNVIGSR
jgi:hypothetical protein